jgi:hypothetical protein
MGKLDKKSDKSIEYKFAETKEAIADIRQRPISVAVTQEITTGELITLEELENLLDIQQKAVKDTQDKIKSIKTALGI